ncbi:recombination protein RecR [Candidatus Woesebacteria bacterium RIFOXYB1_FULL_38_16]|uniref:Recombination protein RecR n=1 Tax=Candidatus Woesebacteria bacterium RIFOXYB1_FULL_38_16 TaxID=1802538 RepID=A0A1F8CUX7_9BACT|nr:MAG: recombination protein RecR [Candidatus Woesebacteria bacterium RIFOXYA1_FULL_38_9]OGM80127.1 MAG: recombination protein RecR [Candidatus Woesebacteria bacterium RIFOXYB1_FULL_38_16]
MKVPKTLSNLIDSFQRLPGIGPKTAQRLSFYLLHVPQTDLDHFSYALGNLKKDTILCSICRNVSDHDPCPICSDHGRINSSILVVEQPLDILAFEKTGKYRGLYHVLHGSINPLDNIGPDELYIKELFDRIPKGISEVIIATNPTMEGDATAMYISKELHRLFPANGKTLQVSRLGMGIPTGASLEFADETTLIQAIEGRKQI